MAAVVRGVDYCMDPTPHSELGNRKVSCQKCKKKYSKNCSSRMALLNERELELDTGTSRVHPICWRHVRAAGDGPMFSWHGLLCPLFVACRGSRWWML